MTLEFEKFALDGHNYPTWTMDIKISLTFRGMYEATIPLADMQQELPPTHQYNTLYIIRHHIHSDLKSEYVLEEELSVSLGCSSESLWTTEGCDLVWGKSQLGLAMPSGL
jgi:hypothetical protein